MKENKGKITLSAEVLMTVARMSALSVPGVSRMADIHGGFNDFFKRGLADGLVVAPYASLLALPLAPQAVLQHTTHTLLVGDLATIYHELCVAGRTDPELQSILRSSSSRFTSSVSCANFSSCFPKICSRSSSVPRSSRYSA